MDGRFASCCLLLHLLLLTVSQASEASHDEFNAVIKMKNEMEDSHITHSSSHMEHMDPSLKFAQASEASHDEKISKENEFNAVIKMKNEMEDSHITHSSSHMEHIDPSLKVFFTINDLKSGKTLAIYFPKRDPSTSPPLLPKKKVDPIPFSSKQLQDILNFFSFSPGSPQAKAVEDTLDQCERNPIKGETKFCATSMESMVDFVQNAFDGNNNNSPIKLLTTTHLTKSNIHFQNYTLIIKRAKIIEAPKLVACHTMPYPYAVYYCHYQEGDNNVLEIPLEGENGDKVNGVAICHMDTSQWSSNHPSFQVLKIKPGMMPVCHFFPSDDFVWIPMSAA